MSEYTPTIEELRNAYRFHGRAVDDYRYKARGKPPMTDAEYDAEFNRCLDRVKAEAWDEGYFRRMDDYPFDPEERDNPYRKEQS